MLSIVRLHQHLRAALHADHSCVPDSVGMQTSRERQHLPRWYVFLQVLSVVGLLQDETDPMVSVMKVQPAALT